MNVFWITLVLFTQVVFAREEWVDPHDMTSSSYREKYKAMYKAKPVDDTHNTSEDGNSKQSTQHCQDVSHNQVYLKRVINLLLNAATFDASTSGDYVGNLRITLTKEDYEYLISFAKSEDVTVEKLRKSVSLLDNSLKKTFYDEYGQNVYSLLDKLYITFSNPVTLTLMVAAIIAYCFLVFPFKNTLVFTLVLAWIADFTQNYLQMIEDAEIKHMSDSKTMGPVPAECDPDRMTFWESFKSYVRYAWGSETKCLQYHRIMYQNIYHSVTPFKVFRRQLDDIIIGPCKSLGTGLGEFSRAVFVTLPWGLNLILFPAVLIFALVLVMIIFSSTTGISLKFGLLYRLLEIDFGRSHNKNQKDSISGKNLEKLLDNQQIHRRIIEEIKDEKKMINEKNGEKEDVPVRKCSCSTSAIKGPALEN